MRYDDSVGDRVSQGLSVKIVLLLVPENYRVAVAAAELADEGRIENG